VRTAVDAVIKLVLRAWTDLQVGLGQGEMAFPMRMLAVKEIDVLGAALALA
jgi:hypothetical protein